MRRWCLAAIVAIGPISIAAEDKVVVQSSGQGGRVTVSGDVVDFTGRELTLRTRVGSGIKRIPRSEVVEVQTNYVPAHADGRQSLREGEIDEAEAALTRALDDEDRSWVRREILADLVRCALWEGDLKKAAGRFFPIVDSDPETIHFGLAPLVWDESTGARLSLADAQTWLRDAKSAQRLVAASWLWSSTTKSPAVRAALDELASDPRLPVQRLAQAQLWRQRLTDGNITPVELKRWETFTERLPAAWRHGPYVLIGRGYEQQQDDLHAAAAYLWLPFDECADRFLAATAMSRGALALERAGDTAAATRLRQELRDRWSHTPAAKSLSR